MNGEQAIDWIHGQYGLGSKEGLTNTKALLERLGHPDRAYRCVHVAGTNGKGSICAMLASVLGQAGYRVGLYTSPYLQRYHERIRIDGEPISDRLLGEVATDVRRHVEDIAQQGLRATVFEIGTACAFTAFARAGVDVAVIEVGIGGAMDSTNVIAPALSVIANIGLDHMAILGDSIQQIAAEKAGIVKPGVPLVLYPQGDPATAVIKAVCDRQGSTLIDAGEVAVSDLHSDAFGHRLTAAYRGFTSRLSLKLPGAHQIDNARTAIAACVALRDGGFSIEDDALQQGLMQATWPGRLEWIGDVLLDGAHNEQGAKALAGYLRDHLPGKRIVGVCGVLRGKAVEAIVDAVAPSLASVHCVSVQGHRAGDPQALCALFAGHGVAAQAHASVERALAAARAQGDAVAVFGSLYLVGSVREMLLSQ